jgi:hypothetical protein
MHSILDIIECGLIILLSFAFYVALLRWRPYTGIYLGTAYATLFGFLLLLPNAFFFTRSTEYLLNDILIYICAMYVFFHFNNMGETARRVRILNELSAAGGCLAINELIIKYDCEEQLSRRISKMIKSDQLIELNGRLFLKKRHIFYASLFIYFLKKQIFSIHKLDKITYGELLTKSPD